MGVLVGKHAPEFKAKAVIEKRIVNDYSLIHLRGKYIVFFFYPLDFTFVCPTELHAFQDYLEEFKKRNTEVIACSVDSQYSHLAWLNTSKAKGGIEGVDYPIISDLNKTIAKDFDVLTPEGISYRGLFIIDREGIIRHQTVNDLSIGRSVHEVIRTLDALIYSEKHGDVCPANWQLGMKSLKPSKEGVESYFSS